MFVFLSDQGNGFFLDSKLPPQLHLKTSLLCHTGESNTWEAQSRKGCVVRRHRSKVGRKGKQR